MKWPQFVGGSGTGRASQADAERTVNFYVEPVAGAGRSSLYLIERGGQSMFENFGSADKSALILLSKPGLSKFAALTNATSVQAMLACNGRAFAAGGGALYELSSTGTVTSRGSLPLATQSATRMCASQSQVLIAVSGNGWIFDLGTNALTQITAAGWPGNVTAIAFIDGYFIALKADSQEFAISGLNDGLSWDALDFGDAEGEQGNIVGMIADHRLLWLMGNTHSEGYYDSGDANFPFARVEGAFMEQGCGALASLVNFDNTIVWLSENRHGARIVWRANGYTPQRISTHAVEAQWAQYPRIDDAVGYTCQMEGHTFYHLDFPSANSGRGATWIYDAASGEWVEWLWWKANEGQYWSDLARTHCYCFGKHLVGDWRSGNVYEQSMQYATDNGDAIRRLRAAPALANGGKFVFFHELRLLCQTGVGLAGTLPSSASVTVPGTAAPWSFLGGINSQWAEGLESAGTEPISVAVEPGSAVAIEYVSGYTNDGGAEWSYDANGYNYPNSPTGNSWPTRYMPGSLLGVMGLVGCFADAAGNVVEPLSIGNSATFAVPGGATQLQLGIDDNDLHNNTGSYVISVAATQATGARAIPGSDPQLILQFSDDGGETWGPERQASLGKLGNYRTLVRWRRLGRSNNRCFRAICSEPVQVALIAADVDIEAADR